MEEFEDENGDGSKQEKNPFLGPNDKPPKSIKFFGFISDDFSPSLKNKYKNYITKVEIFLLEDYGFYAMAVMSTCQMSNGMFDVVHRVHPIKVDIENKQFMIIDPEKGPRTLQECMKVENVDKMIDNVIAAISGEPLAEMKLQMAEQESPDTADFWKDKADDPDWWRKGQKEKPEEKPDEKPKNDKGGLGDIQIPDGI